jgi:hypothetical protein
MIRYTRFPHDTSELHHESAVATLFGKHLEGCPGSLTARRTVAVLSSLPPMVGLMSL